MKIINNVPVIAVKDINRSKLFYQEVFGFEVVHQNPWYIHMRAGGDEKVELGFLASHHPSQPKLFQSFFDGKGLFFSFEVEDVDEEYRRLKEANIQISLEPRDEPWGERHFAIEDPSGILINICKTDPAKRDQISMSAHMRQKDVGVSEKLIQ